jgi:tetrapyrrole methylase family protein/MazG family protein
MTQIRTSKITLIGLDITHVESNSEVLQNLVCFTDCIFSPIPQHPALQRVKDNVRLEFVHINQTDAAQTAEAIFDQANSSELVYVTLGGIFIEDAVARELHKLTRKHNLDIEVIPDIGIMDYAGMVLELSGNLLCNATDLYSVCKQRVPLFPPGGATAISLLYHASNMAKLKTILLNQYPADHPMVVIGYDADWHFLDVRSRLDDIDAIELPHFPVACYFNPLDETSSFESFQEIVARLRAPDGCPWDREQTHSSLRQHLLSETYEVLAALDAQSVPALREELGDLLLQILLHAQIAFESGEFRMGDVIREIIRKLVRRHPHVFGEIDAHDANAVLVNWEKIKEAERKEKGKIAQNGLLDGVSHALPALAQAQEYQERAARVGFDWKEIQGVIDKFHEEIGEVQSAASPEEREKELGDLLFAAVNLIRWYEVDAESALRNSNMRFYNRFNHVLKRVKEEGLSINDLSLQEMDVFWDEAKRMGM